MTDDKVPEAFTKAFPPDRVVVDGVDISGYVKRVDGLPGIGEGAVVHGEQTYEIFREAGRRPVRIRGVLPREIRPSYTSRPESWSQRMAEEHPVLWSAFWTLAVYVVLGLLAALASGWRP